MTLPAGDAFAIVTLQGSQRPN